MSFSFIAFNTYYHLLLRYHDQNNSAIIPSSKCLLDLLTNEALPTIAQTIHSGKIRAPLPMPVDLSCNFRETRVIEPESKIEQRPFALLTVLNNQGEYLVNPKHLSIQKIRLKGYHPFQEPFPPEAETALLGSQLFSMEGEMDYNGFFVVRPSHFKELKIRLLGNIPRPLMGSPSKVRNTLSVTSGNVVELLDGISKMPGFEQFMESSSDMDVSDGENVAESLRPDVLSVYQVS